MYLKQAQSIFLSIFLWQALHWAMKNNCISSGNKTVIPHREIIKQFKIWSWLPKQPHSDFKRPNYITLKKYFFLRENHLAKPILLQGMEWGWKEYSIDCFCEHLVCLLDIIPWEIPKGNLRNFSFASHTQTLCLFQIHTQNPFFLLSFFVVWFFVVVFFFVFFFLLYIEDLKLRTFLLTYYDTVRCTQSIS